jgi:hypothetical protein
LLVPHLLKHCFQRFSIHPFTITTPRCSAKHSVATPGWRRTVVSTQQHASTAVVSCPIDSDRHRTPCTDCPCFEGLVVVSLQLLRCHQQICSNERSAIGVWCFHFNGPSCLVGSL